MTVDRERMNSVRHAEHERTHKKGEERGSSLAKKQA